MKTILLAFAALMAGPAIAADMPVKAPVAVYGWTGFYVGANGGYGWRDRNTSFKTSGGLGGIQLGYNWQLNRAWVGGLEADLDVGDIKGSGTSSNTINVFLLGAVPGTATALDKIQWFGTARARLGFLVANELLLYGTGGFAYGRVALDANYVISSSFGTGNVVSGFSYFCVAGTPCFAGASARVQTGWTAGAGAEWAVGTSNLTFKLEYLYVNLGAAQSFPMTATATLVSRIYSGRGTAGIWTLRCAPAWPSIVCSSTARLAPPGAGSILAPILRLGAVVARNKQPAA
jgi:outer membrane immunogenic protein